MFSNSTTEGAISTTWGRLIFATCMTTSFFYVLLGLFACRRLILANWRWVLIMGLYFIVGVAHAFFFLAVPCVAVACIFGTFAHKSIGIYEMAAYTFIMIVLTVFFALGRKSILYAL